MIEPIKPKDPLFESGNEKSQQKPIEEWIGRAKSAILTSPAFDAQGKALALLPITIVEQDLKAHLPQHQFLDSSWRVKLENDYSLSLDEILRHLKVALPGPSKIIFLPENYKIPGVTDNELASVLGWVKPVGSYVIVSHEGRKGLPNSEEGHPDHEAFHRCMQIAYPFAYYHVLEPHPYLNEALAMAYRISRFNSHLGKLAGMEKRYHTEISLDKLNSLLSLDLLDGSIGYDSSPYPQRYVLSLFLLALSRGIDEQTKLFNLQGGQGKRNLEDILPKNPLERLLVLGLYSISRDRIFGRNGLNRFSYQRYLSIIKDLDQKAQEGVISDEDFWRTFFTQENINLPQTFSYKKMIEYVYQKYGPSVYKLFGYDSRTDESLFYDQINSDDPKQVETLKNWKQMFRRISTAYDELTKLLYPTEYKDYDEQPL